MDKNGVKDYLKHFSNTFSKEIMDYATDTVFLDSRYIFVTNESRKTQSAYCTHCKRSFNANDLRHNKFTICPICKSKCLIKNTSFGRKQLLDEAYFVYFEKLVVNPNIVVARCINAFRDYRKDYFYVETEYFTRAYYIFEQGKASQITNNYWYGSDWRKYQYDVRSSIYSMFNQSNISNDKIVKKCSIESLIAAIEDTPYQYLPFESYWHDDENKDMAPLMGLYCKYPVIEQITKLGFTSLIEEKLANERTYGAIRWHAKNVFKTLKLTRNQVKEIRQKGYKLCFSFLKFIQMAQKDKSKLSIDEIHELNKKYGFLNFNDVEKLLEYMTLYKLYHYIKKQKKKLETSENNIFIDYKDYINDCISLGWGLQDENILFPKNVRTAHQNTIAQKTIKEEKINLKKLEKRKKDLNKKFYFVLNGLFLRAPESINEIIDEGKTLHHCVGSYAKKHSEGSTAILFIRKVNEPQNPFYTLELTPKNEIRQVRGNFNKSPDDIVEAFVEAFKDEKLQPKKKNEIRITVPA